MPRRLPCAGQARTDDWFIPPRWPQSPRGARRAHRARSGGHTSTRPRAVKRRVTPFTRPVQTVTRRGLDIDYAPQMRASAPRLRIVTRNSVSTDTYPRAFQSTST